MILVKYDWELSLGDSPVYGLIWVLFVALHFSFIWTNFLTYLIFFFLFHCSKGWWEYCGGSGLHGTPGADDIILPAYSAQVSSHPQGFPFLHQRHHHWQTHREGERVRIFFFFCVVLLTDYLDYIFHRSVNLFFFPAFLLIILKG